MRRSLALACLPSALAAVHWRLAVDSQLDTADLAYSSDWWQTTTPKGTPAGNRVLPAFYSVHATQLRIQIEDILGKTKSIAFTVPPPAHGTLTLRDLVNSGGLHLGTSHPWSGNIRPYGMECMPSTTPGAANFATELAPGPCSGPAGAICAPMSTNFVPSQQGKPAVPLKAYPHTHFLRSRLGFSVCSKSKKATGKCECGDADFTVGLGLSLTSSGKVNAGQYIFAKAKVYVAGSLKPGHVKKGWALALASLNPYTDDFKYDSSWWFTRTSREHAHNSVGKAYYANTIRQVLLVSNGHAQLARLARPTTLKRAVGSTMGVYALDRDFTTQAKKKPTDAWDLLHSSGLQPLYKCAPLSFNRPYWQTGLLVTSNLGFHARIGVSFAEHYDSSSSHRRYKDRRSNKGCDQPIAVTGLGLKLKASAHTKLGHGPKDIQELGSGAMRGPPHGGTFAPMTVYVR